ncbi:MAG: tRNA (adenosine(37)-N6)-dimethylallyltransferase MiaA [Deltaproteobacteria bacterium]|nr:tRNA (adenosine(37)-N6)-dimethylallyltransferase MiaA [Candidatus Zymogenaceae bacterium]
MIQGLQQPEKIVAVVGPTASGKSKVAVEIAQRVNGEIVYADSVAVYRGLDIGSAKPTEAEKDGIQHHLIDVADPTERYDAMRYAREAQKAITGIVERGRVAIVAGGTGLYLKALIYGLVPAPEADRELRDSLRNRLKAEGAKKLHDELASVDPDSARKIKPRDGVRIVRALEIYHATGLPAGLIRKRHGFSNRRYDVLYLGLSMERELLYRRINERVDEMIRAGIDREVQALLDMGCMHEAHALGAIGYREICGYLKRETDLDKTISLIKRNTRRLAKRQMTWFRKVPDVKWFTYPYPTEDMAGDVVRFIRGTNGEDV